MKQYSRRARGQAVALGLVAAVCHVVNRLSAEAAIREIWPRRDAAMYARLAEDFGRYLVTDENPCDMTEAEMAACWPFDQGSSAAVVLLNCGQDEEAGYPFRERREFYGRQQSVLGRTGFEGCSQVDGLQGWHDIDAPGWICAGGMRASPLAGSVLWYPLYVSRERLK